MTARYQQVREFFLLGKTLKSHGTGGQIRLLIEERLRNYIQPDTYIFFDLDGSKVPFQIADVSEGQHFVVTLGKVDNKEESDKLTGKEIWIPADQIKSRHLKSPRNLKEKWENYHLHDNKSSISYPILRTEEYPQQLMAVIATEDKEILIPLHEQLISDIDKEKKIIYIDIPEGLLEL